MLALSEGASVVDDEGQDVLFRWFPGYGKYKKTPHKTYNKLTSHPTMQYRIPQYGPSGQPAGQTFNFLAGADSGACNRQAVRCFIIVSIYSRTRRSRRHRSSLADVVINHYGPFDGRFWAILNLP